MSQQQEQDEQHQQHEDISYSSSTPLKRTIEDVEIELMNIDDTMFELKKYV